MNKIVNIEEGNDKNGNAMKIVEFDNKAKVWVNSKYDRFLFDSVEVGQSHSLFKENNFNKIALGDPEVPSTPREAGIEKNMDRKEDSIKQAGAQRDAVLIVTTFYPELATDDDKETNIRAKVDYWKAIFLGDQPF